MKTQNQPTSAKAGIRQPRGLRNNNPLNIRRGKARWQGAVDDAQVTDLHFCQFQTLAWGFRASFRLLYNYHFVYHLHTLADIIHRWCPPGDGGNETNVYIATVCRKLTQRTGADYGPTTVLPSPRASLYSEPRQAEVKRLWVEIVVAMAEVENGDAACARAGDLRQQAAEGYRLAFASA